MLEFILNPYEHIHHAAFPKLLNFVTLSENNYQYLMEL